MSNTFIKIKEGTYRIKGKQTSVAGTMFPLVQAFATDKQGGFVTVDAMKVPNFPARNIKIRVDNNKAYEFITEEQFDNSIKHTDANVPGESEAQAISRIRERFDILDTMTEATMEGTVRALIVSGPPGVGKSYGVEEKLNEANIFDKIAEIAIFFGILVGGFAEPYLVFLAISLSLLVSFTRSRAESLGVKLQGIGIGERAERLLVIAIVGIIGFMEYAVIIVIIIASITFVQRIIITVKELNKN